MGIQFRVVEEDQLVRISLHWNLGQSWKASSNTQVFEEGILFSK